jgi:RNA polymerase sigma-70 factor (ECF subfamily)
VAHDTEFERLYEEAYQGVFRAAYLLTGSREEARDVAQETFARAFERWGHISKLANPEGWLHRVAVNLALSRRRRQRIAGKKAPNAPVPAPAPSDNGSDPNLMQALRSLPTAQRAAVVLRYFADQSIDQTAVSLGKPPGTIRSLTSQGTTRLRQLLEESDES